MKSAGANQKGLVLAFSLACAGALNVSAQVTGVWALTDGRYWNLAAAWSNSVIPNGVGHWAWLTGNNNLGAGYSPNPSIISQDVDVTLGYLIFGDTDRGSGVQIRGTNG